MKQYRIGTIVKPHGLKGEVKVYPHTDDLSRFEDASYLIVGETEEKLEILRNADAIFREEIAKAGEDKNISQYFAVITNNKTVGVMGDFRTYDYTLALRGVTTTDFMTADWARIPYEVLDRVSVRIVNEVENINRIVYDITSKPPATIEWE